MSLGWLDCTAGASGDMLLGALAGVGAGEAVAAAVAGLGVGATVTFAPTRRAGLGATRALVQAPATATPRRLPDVLAVLARADLTTPVADRAAAVFVELAATEARVHASAAEDVHFHEVGALDCLADVVGCLAGLHELGLDSLTATPPPLGSGQVRCEHGLLPVPAPAVLELLARAAVPVGTTPPGSTGELLTPTGAVLLAHCVQNWGPAPPMRIDQIGVGAGGRDPDGLANVVRLVVGRPTADSAAGPASGPPVQLECTIDDMDPRLWPGVLDGLLAAGALDAWLTPVLMKKGRPGHVLTALAPADGADRVRAVLFAATTTLGVREIALRARPTLARRVVVVQVQGHSIRVKLALGSTGQVTHAAPEWEDVAALAQALGQPARPLLAAAQAQAAAWLGRPAPAAPRQPPGQPRRVIE